MEGLTKLVGLIVISVLILLGIGFLFAFPTMWLWNWLMPVLFGLIKINIWQAWGINVLTGLLFRVANPNPSLVLK